MKNNRPMYCLESNVIIFLTSDSWWPMAAGGTWCSWWHLVAAALFPLNKNWNPMIVCELCTIYTEIRIHNEFNSLKPLCSILDSPQVFDIRQYSLCSFMNLLLGIIYLLMLNFRPNRMS